MKRTHLLLGCFALATSVIIIIAVGWSSRHQRTAAQREGVRTVTAVPLPTGGIDGDGGLRALLRPKPVSAPRSFGSVPDASYATALRLYREWARYPPQSRPLEPTQLDVLEPETVASAPQPLVYRDSAGEPRASDYSCLLQPSRYQVTEGENVKFALSCRKHQEFSEPAPRDGEAPALEVRTESLNLRHHGEDGKQTTAGLGDASFRDDGRGEDAAAADRIYTLAFRPPATLSGMLELEVAVSLPVAPAQPAVIRAMFVFTPQAPARFTGAVHESMENGSLVLSVEVDVKEPGRYRFYGNLLAEDAPVATSKLDQWLNPGISRVPLLFFGKVLRDRGLAGPYRLAGLRGERLSAAAPGAMRAKAMTQPEAIPQLASDYTTRPYSLAEFSSAEWDSPTKRERLAELEQLASRESSQTPAR